ncbi:MAG: hypothetical protein O2853_00745 [Proteobacteria bacterium]|jgi:hypothetical protein|nr:hypothetical protein [Pseudomonadota bacterium]
MEKLINKKNIAIIAIIGFFLIFLSYFLISKSNKDTEKYFDIYLASLYNEDIQDIDQKMTYLSKIEDPNVSFFADLNLASIENLDKYEKLDRDIILLKKAIIDLDPGTLKSLSLDENFIFSDIAKIYYLNLDINNFDIIYQDNSEKIENFFIKAISRLKNENS